jgi:hypothetical protein
MKFSFRKPTNAVTYDSITGIHATETIRGYRVTSSWFAKGHKDAYSNEHADVIKSDRWTIYIEPRAGGPARTVKGTGSVQFMNQIKDQTLTSLGDAPDLPDQGIDPVRGEAPLGRF